MEQVDEGQQVGSVSARWLTINRHYTQNPFLGLARVNERNRCLRQQLALRYNLVRENMPDAVVGTSDDMLCPSVFPHLRWAESVSNVL